MKNPKEEEPVIVPNVIFEKVGKLISTIQSQNEMISNLTSKQNEQKLRDGRRATVFRIPRNR